VSIMDAERVSASSVGDLSSVKKVLRKAVIATVTPLAAALAIYFLARSTTDKRWQTLILDASALDGPDERQRRADFTPTEMQAGRVFYFEQKDNRSSWMITYRAKVEEASSDRIILAIENVTEVWAYLLRLFGPGDLHSLYILRGLSPGVRGLYILTGARTGSLASSEPAYYVNRAVAIYRHIVGIPTDRDPPVRP
jgi:hypothetical protein